MDQPTLACPPYTAFQTFLTAIECLQQGLPKKLDRALWKSMSGQSQSQAWSAFRDFGLIEEDGAATPILHRLVNANSNRPAVMKEIIESAYPSVLQLARENATMPQLYNEIGKMGVKGDTIRKAVTFFLNAATYAGVELSPNWAAPKRGNSDGKGHRPKPSRNGRSEPTSDSTEKKSEPRKAPPVEHGASPSGEHRTVKLRSGGTVTLTVSAPILSLTPMDRTWLFELVDRFNRYEHPEPEANTAA